MKDLKVIEEFKESVPEKKSACTCCKLQISNRKQIDLKINISGKFIDELCRKRNLRMPLCAKKVILKQRGTSKYLKLMKKQNSWN